MARTSWKEKLEVERHEKDLFLGTSPRSPLPQEDRVAFHGLSYWPPDGRFRFELELEEHDEKTTIEVGDSEGRSRWLWKWGTFRFQLHGTECMLEAYKSDRSEKRLFVPFRDATSGEESYGAGRYLDLKPERDRTEDEKWILDFNEAYNPWCAYNGDYACPLVPRENWLEVPVRAGERKYPLSGE